MQTRVESDSMGEMQLPGDALYGAQTRRAQLNFPVSGWPMPEGVIRALALIKRFAAQANCELGRLDPERTTWIESAAGEIADGQWTAQFPVDVFQTGSGTSTNMNMNEVIANRAIQLAGGVVGSKDPVHPNDHVNMGQSSNDVMPTALHVSLALELHKNLLPTLEALGDVLSEKARLFDPFVKIARTHLQDATPVRMGQVFSGYAAQVGESARRVKNVLPSLLALPLGGTAVGTGINTHPEFAGRVAEKLAAETSLNFVEAANHMEANAARDGVVEAMAACKGVALALNKIANDIRFLASGPRCGLGELQLPSIQPGSSIMPGKVNPVVSESVMQVCAFVVGADAAVAFAAGTLSNFELCTAVPLMAWQSMESIRLLANAMRMLMANALEELACHPDRCAIGLEQSLAMCTSLAPKIGYDAAAQIAKTAYAEHKTVREVARERSGLDEATLTALLDPMSMTSPDDA